MSRMTEYMDKSLYPDLVGNWDDDLFRAILLDRIKPDYYCLDYGAGRGNVAQMNFMGVAKFIAGVDPDEDVIKNPFLNDAKQLDLRTNVIPYADNMFDLVFSDNVMEHVQDPSKVFQEIRRVLKPKGLFLSKTPNKWHYMPGVARLTPMWFHQYYNRLRGRRSFDTFPTAYRVNSERAIQKYSKESGFLVKQLQFIEGRPEYLRLTALTYLLGFLYERLVNATFLLRPFRCFLIWELEKQSKTQPPHAPESI